MITEGDIILSDALSSAAAAEHGEASSGIMLQPGYPNPSNSGSTIEFMLPAPSTGVSLAVTDAAGREVGRLIDGETLSSGIHAVYFDTRGLPVGTYCYTLRVGGRAETGSVVVVR